MVVRAKCTRNMAVHTSVKPSIEDSFKDEIYSRFQTTFQASNETGQQKLNKQKRISTNQATCALDGEVKLASVWQSNKTTVNTLIFSYQNDLYSVKNVERHLGRLPKEGLNQTMVLHKQ